MSSRVMEHERLKARLRMLLRLEEGTRGWMEEEDLTEPEPDLLGASPSRTLVVLKFLIGGLDYVSSFFFFA